MENHKECPICYTKMKDKVHMTCNAMHVFCFKCVLGIIEANNGLIGCPSCRGGDKYIMTTELNNSEDSDDFYSLGYFKKSLRILQKIKNNTFTPNTCLISEANLVCYVKNKKQLAVVHNTKIDDDIFECINWITPESELMIDRLSALRRSDIGSLVYSN